MIHHETPLFDSGNENIQKRSFKIHPDDQYFQCEKIDQSRNVAALSLPFKGDDYFMVTDQTIVVTDGVGSLAGSDLLSQQLAWLVAECIPMYVNETENPDPLLVLRYVAGQLSQAIQEFVMARILPDQVPPEVATTLTVAHIYEFKGKKYLLQIKVGDSKCLVIRQHDDGQRRVMETIKDHRDEEQSTDTEAIYFQETFWQDGNYELRFGFEETLNTARFLSVIELQPGDIVVACSDGATDDAKTKDRAGVNGLINSVATHALQSNPDLAAILTEARERNLGLDDLTLVVRIID